MQEKLAVLRARLTPLISGVLERHGLSEQISAEPFVDAVVQGLISREKQVFLSTRERLLHEANGAPRCWICDLSIPMDAPEDSYACFSVDHVKERRLGGDWHGSENLRAAHRLCNAIRSNPPRPRTFRRYVTFLRELSDVEGRELEVNQVLGRAGLVEPLGEPLSEAG